MHTSRSFGEGSRAHNTKSRVDHSHLTSIRYSLLSPSPSTLISAICFLWILEPPEVLYCSSIAVRDHLMGENLAARNTACLQEKLQRRRAMPQKPVKPSGPSQFPDLHSATLEISWVVQGVSLGHWCSQLTESCVPGWQDPGGSDLPRLEHLQPAFALMAQTTGLVPLSACTRYWSATQRRDRRSLFTG